jgi:DNA-binding transcriptional regulator PaaX
MTFQSKSQRNTILGVLIAARGGEVSLPEILALGIAQFGSRILELRSMGFRIVNRQESRGEQRLSFYRLLPGPGPDVPTPAPQTLETQAELFYSAAHRDDG